MAGQLGNLANRVLALLSTSFNGIVPPVPDSELVEEAARLPEKVARAFAAYELHVGLADIFEFIGAANRRFAQRAPWADAKALLADLTPGDRKATATRLGASLAEQVHGLAIIARCLLPFLPSSAAKLHSRLGIPSPRLYRDPLIVAGVKAAPQAVLFPQRAAA
ncbi:hypothetical protein [Rhizobium leguminosarum]|uniref:hypothetical protein n=1 Tax=Rhizobium leguminosarum TaxID=384 RepID=UPI003CCAE133